jgi:hypothetical protein
MTINTISDSERDPSQSTERTQSPTDAAIDRLAELLPADALEDALKGLEPDEITGPGGLLSQLAGALLGPVAADREKDRVEEQRRDVDVVEVTALERLETLAQLAADPGGGRLGQLPQPGLLAQ